MANNYPLWVAVSSNGAVLEWSLSRRRAETTDKANAGLLSAGQHFQLGTRAKRWEISYRKGYRIRRARIVLEPRHD